MESSELKILPLKPLEEQNKLKREIHPTLPDISKGILCVSIGPIKNGKTVRASNLLLNPNFYYGCFEPENMTIISPTIKQDVSARFLYQKYKDNCYTGFDPKIIKGLVNRQSMYPQGQRPSYCLYCDDIVGEINKLGGKGKEFNHFCTRFRHYTNEGCLVMINSQKFREISPILRANANVYFIGKVYNRKEREAIIEELADSFGGRAIFEKAWDEATSEPYSFLYANLDRTPAELWKNFEKQLV